MNRFQITLLLGAVVSLALAPAVQADLTLYGVEVGEATATTENLYTINTSSGDAISTTAVTGLGSGSGAFFASTFNSTNGLIYATFGFGSPAGSPTELAAINPSTGAATVVTINSGTGSFTGLAFSGGTLYGIENNNTELVKIDTSTGAITNVAALTSNILSLTNSAMTGTFYGLGSASPDGLFTLTTAGVEKTLSSTNPGLFGGSASIAYDSSTGVLYGYGSFGAGSVYSFGTISTTADTFTSMSAVTGSVGFGAFGVATPEPSSVILLLGGGVAVGVWRLTRKTTQVTA